MSDAGNSNRRLTHRMISLPSLLARDEMGDIRVDVLRECPTSMLDPVLDLVGLVAKIACRGDSDGAECFAHDDPDPTVGSLES